MQQKVPLHPTDTPDKAYARLMRLGAYALAARVASQYGLGMVPLARALDMALVRFMKLGFPELTMAFIEELGFTLKEMTVEQIPQFMRELEAYESRQRYMN